MIEQIENGLYSHNQAAKVYGCSQSTIQSWLRKYGKNHLLNKVVHIQTMDEVSYSTALKAGERTQANFGGCSY